MKGWHLGAVALVGLIGLVLMGYAISSHAPRLSSAGGTASQQQTIPPESPAALRPVTAANPTTPSNGGSTAPASPASESNAPVLRILSPKSGDTIQVPATLEYAISGMSASSLEQVRLRLTIGTPAFYTLDFRLNALQGTATLPDDKLIAGRRDLSFFLVTTSGGALSDSAAMTVSNVTIVGRR